MNRTLKFLVCAAAVFSLLAFPLLSEDLEGKILENIRCEGLVHIAEDEVDSLVHPYEGMEYNEGSFIELVQKLYNIEGVSYIEIDSSIIPESQNIEVRFVFHELPTVSSIVFEGSSKVRKSDLEEALTTVGEGSFFDPDIPSRLDPPAGEILALYHKKGFENASVAPSCVLDEGGSAVTLTFAIDEGVQKRVREIAFEGVSAFKEADLRRDLSTKTKSLFNSGYLDKAAVEEDRGKVVAHYQKNGYIDALVTDVRYERIEPEEGKKPKDYEETRVVFVVDEGQKWSFGGLEVVGNTVFGDEEIAALVTMEKGEVCNMEKLSRIIADIGDLYYNKGYIYMAPSVSDKRDDAAMTVSYTLSLTENIQATVTDVVLTGLGKTKENVFRRELTLKPGDVFSKEALGSSYRNLYNTGLLKNLTYNLKPDQDGKGVTVEFVLEEGNQMDIQFGATFGGNVSGFPISGFLQWNDKNLFGTGRTLSVSTNLSPDSQRLEFALGNNWFGDKRWSNRFAFSFSRSKVGGVLQAGLGSPRDDGKEDSRSYPLGYPSREAYEEARFAQPAANYLMAYDLLSFTLGYDTGYTFVFGPGRLALSGGLSLGFNRALYDRDRFNPYEDLIYRYGQKWQLSNRMTAGVRWDGRDLFNYTTKGYVLDQSLTFAGGFLGGLSNYIKSVSSAAGYLKLFGVPDDAGMDKNCVASLSTSLSLMVPQYCKAQDGALWAWRDASEGATTFEMLYIDGMVVGRGFNLVTGLSFLWDNVLSVSYPLARDVVDIETFVSATAARKSLKGLQWDQLGWYMAAGVGLQLKIPGFPLGLYLVKNATFNVAEPKAFAWDDGNLLLGTKLVLAISLGIL